MNYTTMTDADTCSMDFPRAEIDSSKIRCGWPRVRGEQGLVGGSVLTLVTSRTSLPFCKTTEDGENVAILPLITCLIKD